MSKNLQVAWIDLLQRIHSELKLNIQKKKTIFVGQKMHILTVSIVQIVEFQYFKNGAKSFCALKQSTKL